MKNVNYCTPSTTFKLIIIFPRRLNLHWKIQWLLYGKRGFKKMQDALLKRLCRSRSNQLSSFPNYLLLSLRKIIKPRYVFVFIFSIVAANFKTYDRQLSCTKGPVFLLGHFIFAWQLYFLIPELISFLFGARNDFLLRHNILKL